MGIDGIVFNNNLDLLSDIDKEDEVDLFEGEENGDWENLLGVSVGRQFMD